MGVEGHVTELFLDDVFQVSAHASLYAGRLSPGTEECLTASEQPEVESNKNALCSAERVPEEEV
ncbi:hypothetical protein DC3_15750 [Deinococcus cellulosilyticus NBRC 106333 = KACC 11606]|uniref:Uncharacterized protein n=1 Tax=Deinococcus cellulosilyticus (strain DSM 18568 / NBRC 106333 / KACC 11606 / 5516J-15) TaxID=1223518 RepID=A0A511MZ88_DEIC1|nr:hypothetical protein DC3_15750 [Deinococcus cellulosilyticus NBRC 106333 = KACC 11606]